MANRFFSLVIVPDSGNEIKKGSFNLKFAFFLSGFLVTTFIICLFFIIGYHIKLSQEKEFKHALSTMHRLCRTVDISKKTINTLSEKLLTIQRNDIAYRQYAYMDVLDNNMYKAGMGGHVLVDESRFTGLHGNLHNDVMQVLLDVEKLTSRVNIQQKSLNEIDEKIQRNKEEIDSTPSILPTHSYRITTNYAFRIHPITGVREFHDAVDLAGVIGQPIYATADGVVILAEREAALGNCIKIRHKYGYETLYGHLSKILVKSGQRVKKEEVIGEMGSSGRSTGTHIHYAITHLGKKVDPKKYF